MNRLLFTMETEKSPTLLTSPGAALLITIPTGNQSHWGAAQNSEPWEESPSSASVWAQPGSLSLEVELAADTDWHGAHNQTQVLTKIHSNSKKKNKTPRQTDMATNCTHS